jgi:hypothetical protein
MTDPFANLFASAALYPFALDPRRGALSFVPMDMGAYRAASFLDMRLGLRGEWLPIAQVERAMAGARDVRRLHFIFHAGHVGSTLLSRLLDETGRVLPLREPTPLRVLADGFSPARMELLLRLWERGFADTQAVVLKATSATQRLAVPLLRARPEARAVMLNVCAETYLATMLAGKSSAQDLNALGLERSQRLGLLLNAVPPRPTTLGELAAMSWLVEHLTQAQAVREIGARILTIDFDRMLDALPETLARVLAHFEIAGPIPQFGAVLARYSKAPEHGYSPALRKQLLDEARAAYADEIRDALAWLEAVKSRHPALSATV